jgi:hypothetical protein
MRKEGQTVGVWGDRAERLDTSRLGMSASRCRFAARNGRSGSLTRKNWKLLTKNVRREGTAQRRKSLIGHEVVVRIAPLSLPAGVRVATPSLAWRFRRRATPETLVLPPSGGNARRWIAMRRKRQAAQGFEPSKLRQPEASAALLRTVLPDCSLRLDKVSKVLTLSESKLIIGRLVPTGTLCVKPVGSGTGRVRGESAGGGQGLAAEPWRSVARRSARSPLGGRFPPRGCVEKERRS